MGCAAKEEVRTDRVHGVDVRSALEKVGLFVPDDLQRGKEGHR